MEPVKINVSEITAKASSKKEVYRLLQLEGDIYMPPMAQANHSYVAGILSGSKKVNI